MKRFDAIRAHARWLESSERGETNITPDVTHHRDGDVRQRSAETFRKHCRDEGAMVRTRGILNRTLRHERTIIRQGLRCQLRRHRHAHPLPGVRDNSGGKW
jgi:hypothetical protein